MTAVNASAWHFLLRFHVILLHLIHILYFYVNYNAKFQYQKMKLNSYILNLVR